MALLPENKRDQLMLIACVAAFALIYVYYEYVYVKKGATLDTLQERVEQLQSNNAEIRREVARGTVERLSKEAELYGRLLVQMRQLVPVSNEVPTLLDQISNAARETGLEIGPITPQGVIPGEVFDTHRYRMGVSGSYHRIGRFLNNIGSLTRIMAPMNLTLKLSGKPSRRPGEQMLDAGFELQTYVLKVAQRPAPPATGGQ